MKRMIGVVLIGLGIVLVCTGVYLVSHSKGAGPSPDGVVQERGAPVGEVNEAPARVASTGKAGVSEPFGSSPQEGGSSSSSADEAREKGLEFEKYVVRQFNQEYFKVLDWTGDKAVDGIYAESSQKPDLLMGFGKNEPARFYVECKWKSRLYKGGYQLCRPDQLARYQRYAQQEGIPVFIVAGLGGAPSVPAELYCVPLRGLDQPFLNIGVLQQYRKSPKTGFYFDTNLQILQ